MQNYKIANKILRFFDFSTLQTLLFSRKNHTFERNGFNLEVGFLCY